MNRTKWIALLACGVAGYVMTLRDSKHAHAWEYMPFFYGVFGFVGCALLVFGARALGKLGIGQREDFYDDD